MDYLKTIKMKTNLMKYYEELPNKREFVRALNDICQMSMNTVTIWGLGLGQTKDPKKLEALERVTGIPRGKLFERVEA